MWRSLVESVLEGDVDALYENVLFDVEGEVFLFFKKRINFNNTPPRYIADKWKTLPFCAHYWTHRFYDIIMWAKNSPLIDEDNYFRIKDPVGDDVLYCKLLFLKYYLRTPTVFALWQEQRGRHACQFYDYAMSIVEYFYKPLKKLADLNIPVLEQHIEQLLPRKADRRDLVRELNGFVHATHHYMQETINHRKNPTIRIFYYIRYLDPTHTEIPLLIKDGLGILTASDGHVEYVLKFVRDVFENGKRRAQLVVDWRKYLQESEEVTSLGKNGAGEEIDAYDWWKAKNTFNYPELRRIALIYTKFPITNVDVERYFSAYSFITSDSSTGNMGIENKQLRSLVLYNEEIIDLA